MTLETRCKGEFEQPAQPKYKRGDIVTYTDHQERLQRGEILRIEANWNYGVKPSVFYVVTHPTYRNRRFCTWEESIKGKIS